MHSFIKSIDPFNTFKEPNSSLTRHTILLSIPREIRFLFRLGACLTSLTSLTMPSNVFQPNCTFSNYLTTSIITYYNYPTIISLIVHE